MGRARGIRVQAAATGLSHWAAPRSRTPVCRGDLALRAMHCSMWTRTFRTDMEEPAPGEPASYSSGIFHGVSPEEGQEFVLVRPGTLAVEERSGTNPQTVG